MPTRKASEQIKPTLPPDRAIRALSDQLDSLQKISSLRWQQGEAQETEWQTFSMNIIEAAFGKPSTAVQQFESAQLAGSFRYDGMSDQEQQTNFQNGLREQGGVLRSLIGTLQLQIPEEDIKAVYESGDAYAFYRDLTSLFAAVTQDILIVDAYLDEQLFNLYVSKVSIGATVRILSTNIGANVITVARMYASSRPMQMRSSPNIHDRAIFLDQRGWVIGQSIKDAARKKPTYMVELNEPSLTASRNVHNQIWQAATIVI